MNTQRILVVDDEQNIRDIFQSFLQDMGYNVSSAIDGYDALEKIGIQKYDLYIIDIYMPRMGGLELISRLKEMHPEAVIIVMTGYSGLDVDFRSIRQSAFMYLSKPIQPDELLRAVEAGLAQSAKSRAPNAGAPEPETACAPAQDQDKTLQNYLLRGFSPELISQFYSYGVLREYHTGASIPIDKEEGCMVFIEKGKVAVSCQNVQIETLNGGDIWGEETFVAPKAAFSTLTVLEDSVIRHFPRKQIIDFFSNCEKSLIDRFMLNLVQCMHFKHRRSVSRLVAALKNSN